MAGHDRRVRSAGSMECRAHARNGAGYRGSRGRGTGVRQRWEEFRGADTPELSSRENRTDTACIVYSSGTGGAPKGCVLTHGNYLEQCRALTAFYPFGPGVRYLSILPTNHAIDFMVGFIRPFLSGRDGGAFANAASRICAGGLHAIPDHVYGAGAASAEKSGEGVAGAICGIAAASSGPRFSTLETINRAATRHRPKLWLSRRLLPQVHKAFGGELRALCVGGAFTEPATLRIFQRSRNPGRQRIWTDRSGHGGHAGWDLRPFRPDTVGRPLPGIEVRIVNPGADGVGEVAVRGETVMSHYLDDPEMTAETIVDGWLMTGDLGRSMPAGICSWWAARKI